MGCGASTDASYDPWKMAAKGHAQALQRWLVLGGDPNALDRHSGRGTLLHAAAQADQAECIAVLIKAGAQVNAVTKLRGSALHAAAAHKSGRSVRALLSGGADPLLVDAQRRTPITIAEEKGHKAAADMMRAAAPRFQPAAQAVGRDSPRDERIPAVRSAAGSMVRDSMGLHSFESCLSAESYRSGVTGSHRSAASQPTPQAVPGPAPAGPPMSAAKQQAQQAQQVQQARPPSGKQHASSKPAKQLSAKPSFLSWRGSSASLAQIDGAFGYPSWDARLASLVAEEEQPGGRRFVGLISELDTMAGAQLARESAGGAAQPTPRTAGWAALPPEEAAACYADELNLELAAADNGDASSQHLDDLSTFPDDMSTTMALCGDGMLARQGGDELQTTLAFAGCPSAVAAAPAPQRAQQAAAPAALRASAESSQFIEAFLAAAAKQAPAPPAKQRAPAALAASPAKKRAAAPAACSPAAKASLAAPTAAAPLRMTAQGFTDDFLQSVMAASAARRAGAQAGSSTCRGGSQPRRLAQPQAQPQQAQSQAERLASDGSQPARSASTGCAAAAQPQKVQHRPAPAAAVPAAAAAPAPWWMQPQSRQVEVTFS